MVVGAAVVVVAASFGASLLFLVAKTSLGEPLRRRAGERIARFEVGFRADVLGHLVMLRLLSLLPFRLVDLVPAFLGVPLRTYALATCLGILPGTGVHVVVGDGLATLLDAGGRPDLGSIRRPEIVGPLIGLRVPAMVAMAYGRRRRRPNPPANEDRGRSTRCREAAATP